MTTVGDKDTPFLCQLKMEEQIHCAHTVKLTAPGLVIDKGGTVGTELTYSFAANDGLTAQDIGIVGHNPGEYTIFADITSPYYVSANGLKVKKDKIGITIRDAAPDGWGGADHGFRNNFLFDAAVMTEPDLYYKYTHGSGTTTIQFGVATASDRVVVIRNGNNSDLGQTGVSGELTGWSISTPGVYTFRIYIEGIWSGQTSRPDIVVTAYKNGTPFVRSVKRRGVTYVNGPAISTAFNTAIPTSQVIVVTGSYSPGSHTSALANFSPATGIVFVKNGQFGVDATGQFLSPPGATNASVQLQLKDGLGNNFMSLGGTAIKA